MDFATFAAAFRNSAILPRDLLDSYWIINAPVQFGLKGVKCTFRFETTFADADGKAESLVNGKFDIDAENRHTVYILWVSSREDPSLLFCCRLDSKVDNVAVRYGERTPSIIKNMIEGANLSPDDPKFTLINLIGEQEMGMFIRLSIASGDGPSALRLALRTPSAAEWKSHLLMFIQNLQSDLWKERWQRELLEKDALTMKSQIAQMERRRGWLEKEVEMLYAVMQQQQQQQHHQLQQQQQQLLLQPLRSSVPAISIPTESENSPPAVDEATTSAAVQIMDSEESPKASPPGVAADADGGAADSDTASKREPPLTSPHPYAHRNTDLVFKKKRANRSRDALANDDLLIGVASLISCAVCPGEVTLRDLDGIKEHFINQHLDSEHGRCRACTEVVSNTDPVSHMKTHLIKVYACEFCGRKGRKHYLKAHIRIHTGEKPYECDQCARRFADSSTYRRHQMIHTGEKRYSCPVCGRCIARKDNVKTHLKSHAKNLAANESEAAALMETLNAICMRAERNAVSAPPQDSPTSVENNEDQNLLGDFNLLESLKEDEENNDKS